MKYFEAINPTTEESVRKKECDDPKKVDEKINSAQSAYKKWRKFSFEERAKVLKSVASLLRENKSAHAQMMTQEMGKPKKEALGEVEKAAWCTEHYAENAKEYLKTEYINSDSEESYVQYDPLGAVLGILPWNAPYWLAARFYAPALMAGNVCLMKPDPGVPGCGEEIEKVFKEAGAPEGLFQTLYTQNEDTEKVIQDDRIVAVSFTGSTRGGSKVGENAGRSIKPMILELGGSDPFIVFPDADIEKATSVMALSRIINAGQSCIAAKRILVHKDVYDEVVDNLKERFSKLKVGDPAEESTDVGPIARADLLEELHKQVQKTVDQGAKCLLGGEPPKGKGYFFPPTLLADVTHEMCSFTQEVFGPVASVIKVESEDELIELANRSEFGLGASLWMKDIEKAKQLAGEIEAGQVSINSIVKTDPRLPSGGIKKSGVGRELGPHGIKEFTNAKQVRVF